MNEWLGHQELPTARIACGNNRQADNLAIGQAVSNCNCEHLDAKAERVAVVLDALDRRWQHRAVGDGLGAAEPVESRHVQRQRHPLALVALQMWHSGTQLRTWSVGGGGGGGVVWGGGGGGGGLVCCLCCAKASPAVMRRVHASASRAVRAMCYHSP